MSTYTNCPNCKTELKTGILSSTKLLTEIQIGIINEYNETRAEGYCTKCGSELFDQHNQTFQNEKSNLTNYMKSKIGNVPVISTHSPLNWEYRIIGMVTGQSTTGTGVISEFTSSFTDFFGAQSGRYNQKLKAGENMCFSQLRLQTLDLGGNAVIATDIDYSEVGGDKGMLMVCMAGTAIRLTNINILAKEQAEIIENLSYANKRLRELKKYE
ncbi:heavy metal-binding domain-containing protein [Cellulophaga tyrosinoxydans]|uniref:Uncharacterized conserved protein YbjQ, UPF0145 family n=1 Tax=Cellulophaga tyrosinoxydans TaxID=504486 RepID=A0A1W1YUY4_9FLAO|nr:heavy metal-binding domain-containing protein [Cellulophaga tyrosinoxydans]SMC39538.1 Uncharacterized conserved protein YbjQ, UPF0145 family [Cellulophaga tyrosinoxydans]